MFLQILFLIIFLVAFYNVYWKRKGLPPGPLPLPLIGNGLALKNHNGEKAILSWMAKYGNIFTIWLGENPVVLIFNVKTMNETFIKDGETFAGRPKGSSKHNGEHRLGIGGTDGPFWKEQRRFALHILRNFGLGKNMMQEKVLHEVTDLIEHVREQVNAKEEKIDMMAIIDICVGSIINSLTFGYSFDKKNPESFLKLKALATQTVKNFIDIKWKLCQWNITIMKHIPPFDKVYERVKETETTIDAIFNEKIANHKKKIDFEADEEPRDYAEAFLRHQYKLDKDGTKDHNYSDKQLVDSILDIWIAGQETTSSFLAWLVLYMMEYPEIQEKAHTELDKHVGSDRLVTLDDKPNLNYVNAIVAETLRASMQSSINVPHRLMKDAVIEGYHIPEDTLVTYQMQQLFNNDDQFPEAKKFKPERFLDSNGKFFWPFELMPFGIGKRACLGEGLAKLEMYLFAANILNQFKVFHLKNFKAPLTKIIDHATHPIPFKTYVKNRF
uniref:CYtochrome P450 family n=1 Tax=Panagrolaimus superbus TaxID=310955 RepID=A0A914YVV9_9BILA